MLHELLLALLGHTGDVIVNKQGRFVINDEADFLSPPQQVVLNRLLRLGAMYAKLDDFVQHQAPQVSSLYVRALGQGIQKYLERYEQAIGQVEVKVLSKGVVFPLAEMEVELEEFYEVIPELIKVIHEVLVPSNGSHHGVLDSTKLLLLLHHRSRSGYPRVQTCMQELQSYCHRILFRQIVHWMIYSELNDPFCEFFVKKRPTQDHHDESVYLDLEAVPTSYFPANVANSIFFIGKAVQILNQSEKLTSDESQQIIDRMTPFTQSKPFDRLALEYAIETTRTYIASRVYEQVVVQAEFVRFFQTLRDLFLLSKGEIFQALIDRTESRMAGPPTQKIVEEINQYVWPDILREFHLDQDPFANSFTIDVPLETFTSHGFQSTNGFSLQNVGPSARDRSILNVVDHGDHGSVWWEHPQRHLQAFSTSFTLHMTGRANYHFAFQVSNDKSFARSAFTDTSMGDAVSSGRRILVEFSIDRTSRRMYHVNAHIRTLSAEADEPVRTSSHTVSCGAQTDVAHVCLQYALKELPQETDVAPVRFEPVLVAWVNDSQVLEEVTDVHKLLERTAAASECYIGISLSPSLSLSHWQFEKYKHGSVLRPDNTLDDKYRRSGRDLWASFRLDCQVQWPLHLLVRRESVQAYASLFEFLFQLKRLTHAMDRTWKAEMLQGAVSPESRAVLALRSRMSFVLHSLEQYLYVFVIQSNWHKCFDQVTASSDFDQVKRVHEQFVAKVVSKSYIHTSGVRTSLLELMDGCWSFIYAVENQSHADIRGLSASFSKHVEQLESMLSTSSDQDLLLLLDFNGYFAPRG